MLQTQTLKPATFALVKSIQGISELKGLRLIGGTALALQLGHRKSVDLDFFGEWDLKLDLPKLLSTCGKVNIVDKGTRMQFYKVNGVKCDFVTFEYPWLFPEVETDGVRLADIRDIAAMKMHTLASRGMQRDFFDVAELLHHFTLHEMVEFYVKKYSDSSPLVVFRSLAYFEDAEKDKDPPVMLNHTTWEDAKKRIIEALGPTLRKWI